MPDAGHVDRVGGPVDLVDHAVLAAPGGVGGPERGFQLDANTGRVLGQRAEDELETGRRHRFGEFGCERLAGGPGEPDFPGHNRPAARIEASTWLRE